MSQKRKILFLDIDGVCNSAKFAEKNGNKALGIDPEAAELVRRIVADTNCDVVLSSTWRLWDVDKDEVRKKVANFVGITPDFKGQPRGEEIQQWLDDNKANDATYAILDDDGDMLSHQVPNFFQTQWSDGLTPEIAKAVTEHLNAVSTP